MNLETQIREKVAALSTKILEKHPTMPILLQEIHTALLKNPECVTLLTEEEIGVIVSGLEVQTNTFLMTAAASKSPAKNVKSRIQQLGLEAFGG